MGIAGEPATRNYHRGVTVVLPRTNGHNARCGRSQTEQIRLGATVTTALALDDPKNCASNWQMWPNVSSGRARRHQRTEAGVSTSAGLSVTARIGEVEPIERIRDKGVGLTVYFGQRKGMTGTVDFSAEAIAIAVEPPPDCKADGEDEHSGLADAELMACVSRTDLYHPWRELSAEPLSSR